MNYELEQLKNAKDTMIQSYHELTMIIAFGNDDNKVYHDIQANIRESADKIQEQIDKLEGNV